MCYLYVALFPIITESPSRNRDTGFTFWVVKCCWNVAYQLKPSQQALPCCDQVATINKWWLFWYMFRVPLIFLITSEIGTLFILHDAYSMFYYNGLEVGMLRILTICETTIRNSTCKILLMRTLYYHMLS